MIIPMNQWTFYVRHHDVPLLRCSQMGGREPLLNVFCARLKQKTPFMDDEAVSFYHTGECYHLWENPLNQPATKNDSFERCSFGGLSWDRFSQASNLEDTDEKHGSPLLNGNG